MTHSLKLLAFNTAIFFHSKQVFDIWAVASARAPGIQSVQGVLPQLSLKLVTGQALHTEFAK